MHRNAARPSCFYPSMSGLRLLDIDGRRITALAADDNGQFHVACSLEFWKKNHVDLIQSRKHILRPSELDGQLQYPTIWQMSVDCDGFGQIHERRAAKLEIVGGVRVCGCAADA